MMLGITAERLHVLLADGSHLGGTIGICMSGTPNRGAVAFFINRWFPPMWNHRSFARADHPTAERLHFIPNHLDSILSRLLGRAIPSPAQMLYHYDGLLDL